MELKKVKEVNLKKEFVEGNIFGRYENKCEKERIDIFLNIVYLVVLECYKSKFWVRLFFFVVKSDFFLNLMLLLILVFLEFIVIVLMNVVYFDENVFLGCFKNVERKINLVSELELVKFGKNCLMLFDLVFFLEFFVVY